MQKISFVLLIVLFFSSCEKKIEFKLKEAPELLVVDASIENGQDPFVVLTKSINYFSKVSIDIIGRSIINDAEVFISEGARTHKLRRYDQQFGGYIYSYYTSDDLNPSTAIKGEVGKTYNLKINWQGKEYTSTTTIPLSRKTLDSIWWGKAPNTPDTSTKVVVKGKITDPPLFGDYARYFTSVNDGDFLPGLNSVFDDALINGSVYTVDIDKGVDRNADINFDEYNFFKKGDKVVIKFSSIDKATYDFWRTVEFSYQSIGNPFSSPTKILGNISNGALGYFGGYANQYKTITIPR
jgi:Domain of unknown function (DUF4249)